MARGESPGRQMMPRSTAVSRSSSQATCAPPVRQPAFPASAAEHLGDVGQPDQHDRDARPARRRHIHGARMPADPSVAVSSPVAPSLGTSAPRFGSSSVAWLPLGSAEGTGRASSVDVGVRRHGGGPDVGGRPGGRGRLEADPARAGEEQLRPRVHVVGAELPALAADRLAAEEAHGDARRDPERARHDRHRGGELLAVAGATVLALLEEREQVVGAAAVGREAVREAAVLAEPVLQRHGALVAVAVALGDRARDLLDPRRDLGGTNVNSGDTALFDVRGPGRAPRPTGPGRSCGRSS